MSNQIRRYNEIVLNTESLTWIANQISNNLTRKLRRDELADLLSYVRKQAKHNWGTQTGNQILGSIARGAWSKLYGVRKNAFKEKRDIIDVKGDILQDWIGTLDDPNVEVDRLLLMDHDGIPVSRRDAVAADRILDSQLAIAEDNEHFYVTEEQGVLSGYSDTITSELADTAYTMDGEIKAPEEEDDSVIEIDTIAKLDNLGSIDNIIHIDNLELIQEIEKLNLVERVDEVGVVKNVSKFLGKNTEYGIRKMINPKSIYKQAYLSLDSKYRLSENDGTNYVSWNILNNSLISNGSASIVGSLGDIVAIRIYPCRIPYKQTAINNLKRISILIDELRAQSYIAHENRRYHFMCTAESDGNMINLLSLPTPLDSWYKFATPVVRFDKISLTFGAPLVPVIFDKDRLNATVSYVNPSRFIFAEPHNLLTGDNVTMEGFTTGDPSGDAAQINALNSVYGNDVVRVDDYTIEILSADLSTATPIITQVIQIYFQSKRFFIPFEITYIEHPPLSN